jgi:DNA repair protein RecN (Recombination protein N)
VNSLIVSLSLKNFGLFKDANVDFHEKLNVITGESGAGKSMFISAINAFLTGNIPQNLRTDEGNISAFFIVDDEIRDLIKDDFNLDSEELVISSTFTSKRAFFRINGTIVPKELIQKIGKHLIEVHSQDSNILLRDESYQSKLIYSLLRDKKPELFSHYDDYFKEYSSLKSKFEHIPSDPSEIFRKLDILNYQIEEIERLNPVIGEDDELNDRYKALNNVEEIRKNLYEDLNILKDNEEFNLDIAIGNVVYNLSKISDFGFKEYYEQALNIQELLNDLHGNLEYKLEDLNVDPNELQQVGDRLNEIINLKRKYGPSLEDVILKLENMKKEYEYLSELKDEIDLIEPKLKELKKKLKQESNNIIKKSIDYLNSLKKSIEKNLYDLNMKNASIDFRFSDKEPDNTSAHKAILLLKTTPQSPFLNLSEIASGGEMSRILLAMETVFGNDHSIDTMLFDEIDSGVGPRMADVVGEKLEELSKNKQVIVITHMPQVANDANRHFKILKIEKNAKTYSSIIRLNSDERDKEIKDMYGDIVL